MFSEINEVTEELKIFKIHPILDWVRHKGLQNVGNHNLVFNFFPLKYFLQLKILLE
jgi:hypothetical protein